MRNGAEVRACHESSKLHQIIFHSSSIVQDFFNILDAEHDVILYAEVRWLSRGKTLERFCCLLTEIREFLK
jgi:hypothetical protein